MHVHVALVLISHVLHFQIQLLADARINLIHFTAALLTALSDGERYITAYMFSLFVCVVYRTRECERGIVISVAQGFF